MYRPCIYFFFFFNDTATTEIYTLSLHDALPICQRRTVGQLAGQRGHGLVEFVVRHRQGDQPPRLGALGGDPLAGHRSEEHTSELQSQSNLVCRLLLEKKKKQ